MVSLLIVIAVVTFVLGAFVIGISVQSDRSIRAE